jgi:Glycosyl hydrolase family 26
MVKRSITGLVVAATALLLGTAASGGHQSAPRPHVAKSADTKSVCLYSFHHVATLNEFSAMVHRKIDCAMVYNGAAPDWASWEKPWFVVHVNPDLNWAKWKDADPTHRRLVITQNFFPASVNKTAWRRRGAAGAFVGHAKALARNLVAAGLGDSVIRLAHEANGTWYADSVGATKRDFALWREMWRKTAIAMRSVPGAHFKFDWCINAVTRPIPLSDYYPGDDVVDIVGIDAYDAGVPAGQPRWSTIYDRPFGIKDLLDFAKAHGKPLSIPEWGIAAKSAFQSGGDDPAYINGIARVVRDNPVAYQAYFYAHEWSVQLNRSPRSIKAFRRHFGDGGDSVARAAKRVGRKTSTASRASASGPNAARVRGR